MARRHKADNPGPESPESKADKFRRLVNDRMPKLIGRMRQIAALGNAAQYEYTKDQTDKIKAAIVSELDRIEDAFAGKRVSSTEFRID